MKDLLNPRGGLSGLLWETKFIYTLFLFFTIAAYAVMGLMMKGRTGFNTRSIAEYYCGNEGQPGVAEMKYRKTYAEMMETTHFHIFSIPLLVFIQGHIFLLCGWPRGVKVVIVLGAFLGAGLQLGAPWLVWGISPLYAPLVIAGRLLLGGAFAIFTVVPLIAMWRTRGQPS